MNFKRPVPLFLLSAALLFGGLESYGKSLTLDQVMSSPFASFISAAPTGAKVAWLLNENGRRNVWVAEGPDWKARKLTNFGDDDGQEIDELVWAHDGSRLLFTRGGDFEMGRENPNPSVMLTKPDQSIWSVSLDGTPAKKLTEGHSAAISPKGDVVAFIRDSQIWTIKPGGEAVTNAAIQLGKTSGLVWSPKGGELAFVSTRHDHSFIGVYSRAEKSIHYLDPSVDSDESPVWSPDGSRLAFLRIPASTRVFSFGPEREGEPWSVRIADCATGKGQEIFRASTGPGSVFSAVVAPSQLFWTASQRIVFPWEKTGWRHLHSVSTNGGAAMDLTPGEGEVEHVAQAPSNGTLYFSANMNDIDRRHLWSVAGDGQQPAAQLTHGEDIEFEPAPAADGSALLFLASSYNQSAHAAVLAGNNPSKPLAPETIPAFPAAAFVKPKQVIYTASDGMQIHGQLFLPPASGTAKHPALVFSHGGSRRQMLLGFHYMYYYSNAYSLNQYLASLGFVVLSINYRSGIGYGLDFREALNYGATGASEFNDVTGAGLYLKSRADVDPARIGLWGGSYGGYLTALGLARASDIFAAGVDFHGVHNWNEVIENFNPGYDTQKRAEAAKLAFDSSPLAFVGTWRSPVLLIHGDDDRNVPFSETVHLVEALRKQGVPFEQLIFPNEIHDFLLHRDWVSAYRATAEFFTRKLQP